MEKIVKIIAYITCVTSVFCAVKKIASASKASVNAFKTVSVCKKI